MRLRPRNRLQPDALYKRTSLLDTALVAGLPNYTCQQYFGCLRRCRPRFALSRITHFFPDAPRIPNATNNYIEQFGRTDKGRLIVGTVS